MKREYSNPELRALILDWLKRRGRWGAYYFPLDTLVNKLSHVVKNNGKRIRKAVRELIQERYVLVHKRVATISLNSTMSKEIEEHIKRVFKI